MIRWSRWDDKNCDMNQQLFMKKTAEEKEEKSLKKSIWSEQRQEKESWIINELKIHQQLKNWDI